MLEFFNRYSLTINSLYPNDDRLLFSCKSEINSNLTAISQLLPAKRILVNQVFDYFEIMNGYWYITVKKIPFAVFTVAAGRLSWWLFTFLNWSLFFLPCWTIQVSTQALHVVREISETLHLFLKVVSTKAQTRYFQSYSFPKVFSSRLVSFPPLNSFYKSGHIVQNGWSVKLRSGKMTNQSSRTMSAI